MKRLISIGILTLLLTAASLAQSTPTPPAITLKVGDTAPDFTLSDTAGKRVTLSEFRGKNNVVLAFYVFAFTGG
jgi:cytochrome oxidase Cu insertion factor (SCO1/SenC/PrrC family)